MVEIIIAKDIPRYNPEEIKEDFFKFHQYLKIKNKDAHIVPFRLNTPQLRYYAFKETIKKRGLPNRIVILKYRQGGFTTYEQADSFHRASTRKNQEVLTIAHTEESAKKIFKMSKLFAKTQDSDLKETYSETRTSLSFPEKNSNYNLSWCGADSVGETLNKVHITEFALWKTDPMGQLSKVQETVPITGDAELVIESTAQGFNEFYEIYEGAKNGTNAFFPFFIRWFDDPQYQLPLEKGENLQPYSSDEERLIVAYLLTPEQIKFRRFKIGEKNGDINKFLEQYPENDITCFISSGYSYFNTELILNRAIPFAQANLPIKVKKEEGLQIWEKPIPGRKYVMGVDPSEGIGHDEASISIIEAETGRTVLCYNNSKTDPKSLAGIVYYWHTVYNKAYVVPERNNIGHTLISYLISEYGIKKPCWMYYHLDYTEGLRPRKQQLAKIRNKAGYQPGFPTKANTKTQLLTNFKNVLEDQPERILDIETLSQLKYFKRQNDGSIGADKGKKDDRIISRALAEWGRTQGIPNDNFSKNYSIE